MYEGGKCLNNEINLLLIDIKNSNDASFEILFKRMHKPVFALAFSILGDKSLAEDVVQETVIRIKTKSNLYKEGTNGAAWIFQIARNLSLNLIKKRKFEVTLENNKSLEELFIKHSPWAINLKNLILAWKSFCSKKHLQSLMKTSVKL